MNKKKQYKYIFLHLQYYIMGKSSIDMKLIKKNNKKNNKKNKKNNQHK